MSRRTDGREVLARLAYPLPLDLVGPLLGAIGVAAEKAGYTNVSLDMNDQGAIIGTPPGAKIQDGAS